ncbi:MAG: hypothetical protein ACK417_10060 [Bacteroidia bacterium]
MKQITLTIISSLLTILSVQGQDFKKLNVFVTDFFDARASITVEALNYDPLIATDALKNALVMNGFKVISERVAKEKIELSNKGQVTDSTFNQDVSIGKTTYLKSVYVVTLNYQYRADTGCGGSVMSNLSGQIIDLANDGQIVATFSFKQGNFEGKCTSDVMNALAKKLKEQSKNK